MASKINCGKCKKIKKNKKDKIIRCDDDCQKWFHHTCGGTSIEEYYEIQQNMDKFWLCNLCHEKRQKRKLIGLTSTPSLPVASTEEIDANNNHFSQKLDKIIVQLTSHESKLLDLKKLSIIENKLSELQKVVKVFKQTMDTIINENIVLRNENDILRSEIEKNSITIENIKQEKYSKVLEISGINTNNKTYPVIIVSKVLNELNVELKLDDIRNAYLESHQSTNSGLDPVGMGNMNLSAERCVYATNTNTDLTFH
ncbi:uncharacterized protein LOC129615667 [Condylostylus longicornis]|uniref:uncharacterized protein LOC129615667 n=1 Tax=Condylostylus longicornis TaxID=2530218 RepID=UPI00244DB90C|nr:uncharacterized protein LOC129615667 [Condylostylus longicornis]